MTRPGSGDVSAVRQKTIDALMEHFANDVLTVEEFEARVSTAHAAESANELRRLLADLPSGDLPIRREERGPADPEPARASVPPGRVKDRSFVVAALGGVERKGRWIPARQNYAVAILGGMELDFREALLPPGETEVWIFSFMGGTEVIVPPGLTVESDGVAIMGGYEHHENVQVSPDPDAPVLRLKGVAVMAGVEISVRYPGESQRDAKRRNKELKKAQKRLRRGRG
jgi:hypothetical protein